MLRILTSVAVALPAAEAIFVTPSSPCSVKCGNVQGSTPVDDLVCDPKEFVPGGNQMFQSCVECELSSGYSRGTQTDVEAALYNMRLATSFCLFGHEDGSVPDIGVCLTSKACGPFRDAMLFGNVSVEADGYDYCALWPIADDTDFDGCRDCLQSAHFNYMANFFVALQAGCEQQPVPGVLLGLDGSVFSTDDVNITAPSPTAAVDPDWFDDGPLPLGAKVGIAIGGLALLLTVAGFFIVWNGKRRRRAFLRTLEKKYGNQGWPSPQTQGDMFETPSSSRPLRGWDDSPMSVQTEAEKLWPRYVSPYSSQYNSPVNGADVSGMQWPAATLSPQREIGVALGGDDKWAPPYDGGKGKQVQPESYEMHQVESAGQMTAQGQPAHLQNDAPVLGHPGYGRKSDSPPLRYAPYE
jgi:hypothetical protein